MSIGTLVIVVVLAVIIVMAGMRSVKKTGMPPPPVEPEPEVRIDPSLEPFVAWLIAQASAQTGAPIQEDAMAVARIKDAALKTREALASRTSHQISLPFLASDGSSPKHFALEISKEEFLRHR